MGFIKAGKEAISSTLKDSWKEAIRCEEFEDGVLMIEKTTPTGVISNKSIIIVAPGQCAVIFDNGRLIDATAEEGTYLFDTSSTPTFFAGQFKDTFKEMWKRFTYNGVSSQQQSVYYFNLKEIFENRFGTAIPIPYQDWSHPLKNEMTNVISPLRLEIKCFGKYTFRVSDPALFMAKIAGTAEVYTKDQLVEQIKAEVISVVQNIINELGDSEHRVPVLELPSQTDEIKQIMDSRECDKALRDRGITLGSFNIESVTLTEESKDKIDNYEYSTNSYLQKGKMVDAYANAVVGASRNPSGVLGGMMGIGVMNMSADGTIRDVAQNAFGHKEENLQEGEWECPKCKKIVTGNFCSECGTKKEELTKCPSCGKEVDPKSKFCPNCGNKIK